MAKKKKAYSNEERISQWLASLKLKDLQRACIMRGFTFILLGESDVNEMQSWILRNYDNAVDHNRLVEFDAWRDDHLKKQGFIKEPLHTSLKLGFYLIDEDGNETFKRRNIMLMGANKSQAEIAAFRPRKGSMKTRVFDLILEDKGTKEIIKIMAKEFPQAKEGSVKAWCSQARKTKKAKENLS